MKMKTPQKKTEMHCRQYDQKYNAECNKTYSRAYNEAYNEAYNRGYNRGRYQCFYKFGKITILDNKEDKNDYETFLKHMCAAGFTKCEADFYNIYIQERLGPSVRTKKRRKR